MKRREYLATAGIGVGVFSGFMITQGDKDNDMPNRSTRGEGEPITVERQLNPESIEYIEQTNEIRYPAFRQSPDKVVEYDTKPFEEWARGKCAYVGSSKVLPTIAARLGRDKVDVGKAVGPRSSLVENIVDTILDRPTDYVIQVTHTVTRNRKGQIINRPDVEYHRLVDVTPSRVVTTITFAGKEFTEEVPTVVTHGETALL